MCPRTHTRTHDHTHTHRKSNNQLLALSPIFVSVSAAALGFLLNIHEALLGFSSENKKRGRFQKGGSQSDGACITSHGQIFNFGLQHVPIPFLGIGCCLPFLFQAATIKRPKRNKNQRHVCLLTTHRHSLFCFFPKKKLIMVDMIVIFDTELYSQKQVVHTFWNSYLQENKGWLDLK